MIDATYSPEDNKIRLRSVQRLDSETYARVKAAGFSWAPKQDLFVAPMWTPEREDLAVELAGEIGDEDTTLVERAEDRAERFEGYRDKRAADAEAAHAAVEQVSKRFEFGQPILVGHHSERKARKDAERIENGMRKAVKMWETSKYWEARAKGALRAAKYKELPAVRHRRIKGLEADLRKQIKAREYAMAMIKAWSGEGLTPERARTIANYDGGTGVSAWSRLDDAITGRSTEAPADVLAAVGPQSIAVHTRTAERCERWIGHLTNRVAYEKAMLEDGGGIAANKFDLAIGGRILVGRGWAIITRLNRKDGAIVSVSVAGRSYGAIGIESIRDYRAPEPGDAEKVAKATKLAPIVNYPTEGCIEVTSEEWNRWMRSQSGGVWKADATETHGAYRYRQVMRGGYLKQVYVTDMKRVERPVLAKDAPETAPELPEVPPTEPRSQRVQEAPKPTVFDAMKESLKAGVTVASAPSLFPTPTKLADRMVKLLGLGPEKRVLEPSAGTGRLVHELRDYGLEVTAVEISGRLAGLSWASRCELVRCADFMTLSPEDLGERFDGVCMNPPFANGEDIRHILHAFDFLTPGGKLVALCANGPRQREQLGQWVRTLGGTWEDLPDGSFASEGTNVRVAMLSVSAHG